MDKQENNKQYFYNKFNEEQKNIFTSAIIE